MKLFLLLTLLSLPALALETIEPARLADFITERDALVVDVRSPAEYAAGHVPGAINLPHDRIIAEPALLAAHRDRPLVLYCRSGRRAALAAQSLQQAGFQPYHLEGDMPGWQQRQGPVALGDSAGCLTC